MPQVTSELPTHSVPFKSEWDHLKGLQLADPDFGCPDYIDILLWVDVFVDIVLTGRQFGQPGTLIAFETHSGWVLSGSVDGNTTTDRLISYHM